MKMFATFGFKYRKLSQSFLVLEGTDENDIRRKAFEATDGRFCFLYPIIDLARQQESYHLTKIEIADLDFSLYDDED